MSLRQSPVAGGVNRRMRAQSELEQERASLRAGPREKQEALGMD